MAIRRPWTLAALRALTRQIAALRVDEAYLLTSSHQSALPLALLLRTAGVPSLTAISHDYAGSLLDRRIPGDPDVHEVERNLMVVAGGGHRLSQGDAGDLALRAPVLAPDRPSGYTVVHPGASVPARTWTPERWSELVERLCARGRPRRRHRRSERGGAGGSGDRQRRRSRRGTGAGALRRPPPQS